MNVISDKSFWLAPRSLTVAALLLLIAASFGWHNFFDPIDKFGSDVLLSMHAKHRAPPDNIVLINIDQASLDHPQMLELAGNWPWARLVHGELLSYLAKQQARAVIFDITFSEPDVFNLPSDAAFAEAIAKSNIPVYLPLVILKDGTGSPLSALPAITGIKRLPEASPTVTLPLLAPKALPVSLWRTGHINFLTDADQIGRRAELYREQQGWEIPALAARVAEEQGAVAPKQKDIIINWYGQPFAQASYHEVYFKALSADTAPNVSLKDKIIIIGSTAPGLVDFRPTPLSAATPGQKILATTIANLQQSDWLLPMNPLWSGVLALVLVALPLLGAKRMRHPLLVGAAGLVLSVAAVITAYLLLRINLQWQPFSAIAIGVIAHVSLGTESYLQEKRKRQHAMQLFSRFLDPNVVLQLTNQSSIADAEVGRSQEVTVLFSDIRGFTTLSETRRPEEIVSLLNRYFDQQVDAVFEHQGTLDKFIGDAIMAFWGAPIRTENHAIKAVSAALTMSDNLEKFKKDLNYPFEIGIGIHTGNAVVGLIGSRKRLDYTAIGDAVNLASRIEGETKGIARILVSESTKLACGNTFDFIDHGEFKVKGRTQSVRLFEPRRK